MTTLAQIVDGIETRLKTLTGLQVHKKIPDTITPITAWVNPVPITDYRDSLDDDTLYSFEVILMASANLDDHQLDLVPYLERSGAKSIFAAFETARGLGFTDVDAHVRTARPLGLQEVAGYGGWGAAVTVSVSLAGPP